MIRFEGRCRDCKFYQIGFCHRFPPVYTSAFKHPGFPRVEELDWCGEFKDKEERGKNNE